MTGWARTKADAGKVAFSDGQTVTNINSPYNLTRTLYTVWKSNSSGVAKQNPSVACKTHVQTYGWQGWKSDGVMAGTSGESKRLEAIQIKLTGEMAKHYDIYYKVHAQTYGWLDWAKNGSEAGTSGLSKRLEAIQIKLVKKNAAAPGKTARPYIKK